MANWLSVSIGNYDTQVHADAFLNCVASYSMDYMYIETSHNMDNLWYIARKLVHLQS